MFLLNWGTPSVGIKKEHQAYSTSFLLEYFPPFNVRGKEMGTKQQTGLSKGGDLFKSQCFFKIRDPPLGDHAGMKFVGISEKVFSFLNLRYPSWGTMQKCNMCDSLKKAFAFLKIRERPLMWKIGNLREVLESENCSCALICLWQRD